MSSVPISPVDDLAVSDRPFLYTSPVGRSSVSWGAIFAGLTATLALQVLLMMLGAGLGFAVYSPLTDENPVADLGKGAMVIQGISAVVALWFGGWVAGRLTPAAARGTGFLHGFSVWCAATVSSVLIVTLGAGWVLGDLSKVVGGGLSLAGKPAAAAAGGATDLAQEALQKSSATLESFADEAFGTRAEAPNSRPAAGTIRARRELGFALTRFFTPAPGGETDSAPRRAALQKALMDASGLNETQAERMIADWTASYERLRADLSAAKDAAAAKARAIADEAADKLAVFSLCAFAAFVIGALSAAAGGRHGARCATKAEGDAATRHALV